MNCRTSVIARILSFSALIAVFLCCQGAQGNAKEDVPSTTHTVAEQEEDEEPLLLSQGDQVGEVEGENRGDPYLPKNCDEKIFEPEEQWKEICKDQHIPPGIEVRMDVNRGKKWGRLSPESKEAADSRKAKAADSVEQAPVEPQGNVAEETNEEEENKDPVEQMKKVLEGLPDPDPEMKKALGQNLPPEKMQEILTRVWERRQRELGDAIKKMKTEAQQMHSLLQDLGDNTVRHAEGAPNATDAMVTNLEDLEYYVGKADNARDFAKMGGLETSLMLMNHTESVVRETAAWVIGSTVKMEKELQDLAVSIGAVPMLIQSINQTVDLDSSDILPTLQQIRLVNKCIYAVGGIIRRNPSAQTQLINMEGGRILVRLASNTVTALGRVNATETLDSQQWSKGLVLVSKVVTLFGDMFNDIPYAPRPKRESQEESDSTSESAPQLTIRKEDGSFTDIDNPSQHGHEVDVSSQMKQFLQGEEVGNLLLTYVEMLSKFLGQAEKDGVQQLDLTEDHLDKALQALISAHKGGIFYGASEIDSDLLADTISYLQQLRDRYYSLSENGSEDVAMLAEMRRYRVATVLGLMNEYA